MEPKRKLCPYCNGSALDLWGGSGESCPHCFGGYQLDTDSQEDEREEKNSEESES